MWQTGLSPAEALDLARARTTTAESHRELLEIISAFDATAQQDHGSMHAALWLPASAGGAARGGLRIWYHPVERPEDASWESFLAVAQEGPITPGVTLTGYSVSSAVLPSGPVVIQYLETCPPDGGPQLSTFRATIFPETRANVYVLEFETIFPALLDELEDSVVDILNSVTVEESR